MSCYTLYICTEIANYICNLIREDIRNIKLKVESLQLNKNITPPDQASKLKYGLGVYATPRVNKDIYQIATNTVNRNPIEQIYENFLLRYNKNALIERYLSDEAINNMLEKAPCVKNILEEKGVNTVVCKENLKNIKDTHINTTVEYSMKLANELNLSKSDKQAVALGSLFHDFGKIMIPQELLNKNGKLTSEERAVVDTHSRIGYEMLKTTGMNQKALSIVRNHHRSASMTNDYLSKIVSVADVYSALTEKRAYKNSMSSEDALLIMDTFVQSGKLDKGIVQALKTTLEKENSQAA